MVFAHVYDIADDSDEPVVPDRIRTVFVEGTPAAEDVSELRRGDRLHVLGIPRVNLSEVYAAAIRHGQEGFCGKLPYEMIISAVYPLKRSDGRVSIVTATSLPATSLSRDARLHYPTGVFATTSIHILMRAETFWPCLSFFTVILWT